MTASPKPRRVGSRVPTVLALAILALNVGCSSGVSSPSPTRDLDFHRYARLVGDPRASKDSVFDALASLRKMPPTMEERELLAGVANDNRYDGYRRQWALLQLFSRFVSDGMTVEDLSRIAAPNVWLSDTTWSYVDVVAGRLPLNRCQGHVLRIVLHFPATAEAGIYLCLSERPAIEDLKAYFRGVGGAMPEVVIQEKGFSLSGRMERAIISKSESDLQSRCASIMFVRAKRLLSAPPTRMPWSPPMSRVFQQARARH